MAPISEKRLQAQSQLKESGNHGHTHAKENASRVQQTKGSLEILDFHESWLEEMELYKDMYINRHGHHQKQQMLGSHNHQHTVEGDCQIDGHPTYNSSYTQGSQSVASGATSATGKNGNINSNNNNSNNSTSRHKGVPMESPHGHGNAKTRVIRSSVSSATAAANNHKAAAVASVPATTDSSPTKGSNGQLLLKRQRDEISSNGKAISKRHVHARSNVHNGSPPQSPHATTAIGAAAQPVQIINAAKNGTYNTLTAHIRPASKIIVNQFHASSLLNAQQLDDKVKILTQNGLTKSAATAYETSVYASNYLPPETRPNYASPKVTVAPHVESNNNNVGVFLASHHGPTERHNKDNRDEDPAAAIDEVNNFTETDSDDEYVGQPFFLTDDGAQTQQSRHVRDHIETTTTTATDNDGDVMENSEYYVPKSILSPSLFPNVPPYLNFSSHVHKGPAMPQALHKVLKWKLSPVMPKIVKRVVLNSGFRIIKNTTDWMAIWEKHMKSPGFRTIRSHQKYNHMPGSFRIGRKDCMWRSIQMNIKKFGGNEFGFMQKSFIMPDDLENLRQIWPKHATRLAKWIVKPPASARGTGIRIVNKWSQFPKDRPLVVQKYIERPLLINDSKFDMRIYVVLTSINPLRIYMYKDGLARFASVKYSSELGNLDDRCMHLTNYSINKLNQNYSKNEDFYACQGHKWTLQSLWSCLEKRGINTKRLWATLRNLVIKAIISGEPGLNRMYRQNVNFRYNCFELFGFDILLDENIIPWLLEINISPSLHSELPLDLHVKGPLIQAVLNTALYQVPPKLNEKAQADILTELNIKTGPLCLDKRVFTTCLTAEEVRKHNQFTNRSIEFREDYLDAILDNLLPDDVRCLIITEDEFARCHPLERIFPTADTHEYLKFIDNPRYYNRLLDAWENRYKYRRQEGIALLRGLCKDGYHLIVSDAALEKEPNVTLTEIDMLHARKPEETSIPITFDGKNTGDYLSTSAVLSADTHEVLIATHNF